MEFKGTKEKWEVFTDSYTNEITIYPSDSTVAICSVANTYERNKYDALLISKAPEMLEKLSEIVNILDIKCTDGCVNKTWGDFQNGNGEDVGLEIDKFIKDTEQLIKEATEL